MFFKLSLLWLAVILVHIWLVFETVINPQTSPLNDVVLYGVWLKQMAHFHFLYGINTPWVYPFLALVPMYLAKLLGGSAGIMTGWIVLIGILNLVGVSAIVDWGREGKRAFTAAGFYLAFIALLGPVAIGRIDAPATFLAMLGLVQVYRDRPRLAMIFFTLGAWIKIWPVAAAMSLFVSAIRRFQVAIFAIGTSVALLAAGLLIGGNSSLLSFVTMQGNRGIQIESPVALIWLWAAFAKVPGVGIYFDTQLVTNQIYGSFVNTASTVMDFVLVGAIAITVWLSVRAHRLGAEPKHLFAVASTTAALDLIFFNKVGSPQYEIWLVVPLMAGILFGLPKWRIGAGLGLAIAFLTNLIYPVFYSNLISLGLFGISLITVRNALLLALLIWLNLQLASLARKPDSSLARKPDLREV